MYLLVDNQTDSLDYSEVVTLEGVEYLFDFRWSDRESRWYLCLYDQDENPIALSVALVVSPGRIANSVIPGTKNLLRRFVDPRLPPGVLFCADMTGQAQEIAASSDLGSRVLLWYLTSDDPRIANASNSFVRAL